MSTASQIRPGAPGRHETFVEDQLARARSRIRLLDLAAAGLGFLIVTLGYGLLMVVLDRLLELPSLARQAAFVTYLVGGTVFLGVALGRVLFRRINPYFAAKQVEGVLPGAKNSVVNYLDLRDRELPAAIRGAVSQRAAKDLARADLDQAISTRRTGWLGGAVAGLVFGLFILFFLGPPQFLSLLRRAFAPFQETTIATRTRLTLLQPEAGDLTVAVGRPVSFVVAVDGHVPDPGRPDAPRLLFRHQPTDPYAERPLEHPDGRGDWGTALPAAEVQNGFWYKIAAGDAETPEYRVTVRANPLIESIEVQYHYRPYLNRPDATSREANIEALRGTEITLTARTNRVVREGFLDLADDKPLAAEPVPGDPKALRFRFVVDKDGPYRVRFTSQEGERNAEQAPYTVRALRDVAPRVELTKPGQPVELPADGLLKLEGSARDDYGLTALKLRVRGDHVEHDQAYRAGKSFRFENGNFPLKLDYKDFVDLGKVKLANGQPLQPGMELEYWLEATDNCDYPEKEAPNVGRSEKFTVKIVAPEKNPPKQQQERQQAQKEQKDHDQKQDQKLEQEKQEREKQDQQKQDGQQQPKDNPENQDGTQGGKEGKGEDNPNNQKPNNQDPNRSEKNPKDQNPDGGQKNPNGKNGNDKQEQNGANGSQDQKPKDPQGQQKNDSNQKGQNPKNSDGQPGERPNDPNGKGEAGKQPNKGENSQPNQGESGQGADEKKLEETKNKLENALNQQAKERNQGKQDSGQGQQNTDPQGGKNEPKPGQEGAKGEQPQDKNNKADGQKPNQSGDKNPTQEGAKGEPKPGDVNPKGEKNPGQEGKATDQKPGDQKPNGGPKSGENNPKGDKNPAQQGAKGEQNPGDKNQQGGSNTDPQGAKDERKPNPEGNKGDNPGQKKAGEDQKPGEQGPKGENRPGQDGNKGEKKPNQGDPQTGTQKPGANQTPGDKKPAPGDEKGEKKPEGSGQKPTQDQTGSAPKPDQPGARGEKKLDQDGNKGGSQPGSEGAKGEKKPESDKPSGGQKSGQEPGAGDQKPSQGAAQSDKKPGEGSNPTEKPGSGKKPAVEELLQALKNGDAKVREDAAKRLEDARDTVKDPRLKKAIEDALKENQKAEQAAGPKGSPEKGTGDKKAGQPGERAGAKPGPDGNEPGKVNTPDGQKPDPRDAKEGTPKPGESGSNPGEGQGKGEQGPKGAEGQKVEGNNRDPKGDNPGGSPDGPGGARRSPATAGPDAPKGSAPDARFGQKAGDLQLDDFKKRVNKDVLKKANVTEEEYREWLKAYEAMLKRKEQTPAGPEDKLLDPKDRAGGNLRNIGARRVKAEGKDDKAQGRGIALPPPELREPYKEFTEKLSTLERSREKK